MRIITIIHSEYIFVLCYTSLQFKSKDGTGGCDGCLNWKGVGHRWTKNDLKGDRSLPNIADTNNNGLEGSVEYLEKIYRDPLYPTNKYVLGTNMKYLKILFP